MSEMQPVDLGDQLWLHVWDGKYSLICRRIRAQNNLSLHGRRSIEEGYALDHILLPLVNQTQFQVGRRIQAMTKIISRSSM